MSEQPYIYPHTVAICTLADETLNAQLQQAIAKKGNLEGLIIAPLTTENIGIEQIIEFSLSQPQLRHLIICGHDAQQQIGWLPGGTLVALGQHGITGDNNQVINAPGKRPVLKNLTVEAIDHFRQQVTIHDCIGEQDADKVLALTQQLIGQQPQPFTRYSGAIKASKPIIQATATGDIVSDPKGYVIINTDSNRLSAQQFTPQGELLRTITGDCPKAIYMSLIEHDAISRLDHAAYIGRELARAQACMNSGTTYTQDAKL